MCNLSYSTDGLNLTKGFEGLQLTAYPDQTGVWTIGYGHTSPGVHRGMTITEGEAEIFLESDIAGSVAAVNRLVTCEIDQCHFDALVDFVFNLGCASLSQSTLLRMINKGDLAGAQLQFHLWDHAGGVVIPGLLRRREAEAQLFAGPAVSAPPTLSVVGAAA